MNKVSFHLKRPKESKPQSVFALYYVGRKAAKFYSGISIHPKNWNPKRQRVKSSSRNAAIFNSRLDQVETDILSAVRDLENAHVPLNPERVRSRYNELTQKNSERRDLGFFDVYDEWLQQAQNVRTASTITVYRSTRKHLENYAKARGAQITFDRMDREFMNSFIEYLLRIANLQNSTLWKVIKTWKTFMNWSLEQGYTQDRFFESITKASLAKSGFKAHETAMIRLTEEELQAIAELDLTDVPALDNARNLFVLQCSLGVRFGDLQKIVAAPTDYVSGNTIRLITQKNRKKITIPLLGVARHILEHSSELHSISNQKSNAFIKEVARRAGITDSVIVTTFQGVERTDSVLSKYEAVTTHTAKRTFVTLMIARGISTEAIMKVTGNSRSTIDRYIYLNDEDIEREMMKAADLIGTGLKK